MAGSSAKNAADRVFDTLADKVRRCEIRAGERLTELGLAREFGVSRTPVRAALRRLEEEGYVEKTGARGYAVSTADLMTIVHIYAVRAVLEELAVELAAGAVGTPAFEEFHAAVSKAATGNDAELREAFHERLAELSGNPELVRILRAIDRQIYAFRRLDAMISGRSELAQREHAEIVHLLSRGQTDEAKVAMRKHIEISQSTVRSLVRAGVTTMSFGVAGDNGRATRIGDWEGSSGVYGKEGRDVEPTEVAQVRS